MKNVRPLFSGVNVASIAAKLQRLPHIWNTNTFRTENPTSPHHGLDDIWVRYDGNDSTDHCGPHESVWYPVIKELPEIRNICYDLMRLVEGEQLGGVLITRIPPGKMCKPHHDRGGWHSAYYDKYAVQIQGNQLQAFCFDEESFSANPGDVYWFNNQEVHWVTNESEEDRITMIVCIRHARFKENT